MKQYEKISLADFSSFGVGGNADLLIEITKSDDLLKILSEDNLPKPYWFLGFGTNTLISDKGLPGTTFIVRDGDFSILEGDTPILESDAGVWWDDVVFHSVENGYWGLELMSGIPGSVGAAVVGNIAAYGQATADSLVSVDVIDVENPSTSGITTIPAQKLGLSYRFSNFQDDDKKDLFILKARFKLSLSKTQQLEYESATKIAEELGFNIDNLSERRETILEARKRAGSLYLGKKSEFHTAGSFFRNPMVDAQKMDEIIKFEEKKVSSAAIKSQNKIHGGKTNRVSAAHVMLAAGYDRGQSWGAVRLHPDHVLKIENTGGATAQEIYDVAHEIVETVQTKLGVELKPEVRFLGDFS